MLTEHKDSMRSSRDELHNALLTLWFLMSMREITQLQRWIGLYKKDNWTKSDYIMNVITSEWREGNALHWGRDFVCFRWGGGQWFHHILHICCCRKVYYWWKFICLQAPTKLKWPWQDSPLRRLKRMLSC